MRSITLAALLVLASAAPTVASAQATGDVAAGKLKAYTCTGCHGITGYRNVYPHYHVPRISGQNYQYLVAALNAYKTGQRKHSTMAAQAQSLTEQDIADIASYLATNPTTP
jgi:cytochrome c553